MALLPDTRLHLPATTDMLSMQPDERMLLQRPIQRVCERPNLPSSEMLRGILEKSALPDSTSTSCLKKITGKNSTGLTKVRTNVQILEFAKCTNSAGDSLDFMIVDGNSGYNIGKNTNIIHQDTHRGNYALEPVLRSPTGCYGAANNSHHMWRRCNSIGFPTPGCYLERHVQRISC